MELEDLTLALVRTLGVGRGIGGEGSQGWMVSLALGLARSEESQQSLVVPQDPEWDLEAIQLTGCPPALPPSSMEMKQKNEIFHNSTSLKRYHFGALHALWEYFKRLVSGTAGPLKQFNCYVYPQPMYILYYSTLFLITDACQCIILFLLSSEASRNCR